MSSTCSRYDGWVRLVGRDHEAARLICVRSNPLQVTCMGRSWLVERRYSEFKKLHKALRLKVRTNLRARPNTHVSHISQTTPRSDVRIHIQETTLAQQTFPRKRFVFNLQPFAIRERQALFQASASTHASPIPTPDPFTINEHTRTPHRPTSTQSSGWASPPSPPPPRPRRHNPTAVTRSGSFSKWADTSASSRRPLPPRPPAPGPSPRSAAPRCT